MKTWIVLSAENDFCINCIAIWIDKGNADAGVCVVGVAFFGVYGKRPSFSVVYNRSICLLESRYLREVILLVPNASKIYM